MSDDNLLGAAVGGLVTLAIVDRVLYPRRRYYSPRRRVRRRKSK